MSRLIKRQEVRDDFLQRLFFQPRATSKVSYVVLTLIDAIGEHGLPYPDLAEKLGADSNEPRSPRYRQIADNIRKNPDYFETSELSRAECDNMGLTGYYSRLPRWVSLTREGKELLAIIHKCKYKTTTRRRA